LIAAKPIPKTRIRKKSPSLVTLRALLCTVKEKEVGE